MTARLCLDCRRRVPAHWVERGEAGGWWGCNFPVVCAIERADVDGGATTSEVGAAEAKRRGLHVETVGTTADGGTVWEVRRR